MKQLFVFLSIFIIHFKAIGQITNADYFWSCIDSIYQDSICNSDLDFLYRDKADSLVLNVFQFSDTVLRNKVYQLLNLMEEVPREDEYFTFRSPTEEKFYYDCLNYYIYQKKYAELPPEQIISTILSEGALSVLNYLPISKDTSFLIGLIRDSIFNAKEFAYSNLYRIFDSIQMTNFYHNNSYYFKQDTHLFFKLLVDFKSNHNPISLELSDEINYISMFDTSEYWQKEYYQYIFKDGPDPILKRFDSIYWANKPEEDRKFEDWKLQKEIEREEFYRINDSISLATIYDRIGLYWKYAYSDTTLWEANGSVPVLEVDDGMRFDTLTTEEIFNRLKLIDFHEVYDTAQSMWSLNHKVVVIHLRKIFQLLGDRCAYGLFFPDSSQRLVLDQWIDDYYAMACNDTVFDKKREAGRQLHRMWRLLYPKLKNWIDIEDKCIDGMLGILKQLIYLITEPMVLDIIADGDAAFASGDLAKVSYIGYFLATIWRDVQVPENQRIQRRPVRTATETQHWVDAYIYPALVRWNHPTSWK